MQKKNNTQIMDIFMEKAIIITYIERFHETNKRNINKGSDFVMIDKYIT